MLDGMFKHRARPAETIGCIEQAVDLRSVPRLFARFPSNHKEGNTNKLLSAMRQAFGGHVEPR